MEKTLERKNTLQKKDKWFMMMLMTAAVAIAVIYYEGSMNIQNCATYLFSYKYGFIPRALIGTIINIFAKIFGIEIHYSTELGISAVATIIYFVCLFILYMVILQRTEEKYKFSVKIIMCFFSVFSFTEYVTWNNFGRMDEYLTIILYICLVLLITEKNEWLIVPLCFVGCLVHTGFVFTHIGLILGILFWKMVRKGKLDRKYSIIFLSTFIVVSVIFVYMEILRLPVSEDVYRIIEQRSIVLASEGNNMDYLPTVYSLLDSELLRHDVYEYESLWHYINRREVPVFLVLFMPYGVVLWKILRKAICKIEDIGEKIGVVGLILGIVTIVPELVLKVDFGRWFYCIIMYYALLLLSMMALQNSAIAEATCEVVTKEKRKWCITLLIYAFAFVPLRDVLVSDFTYSIAEKLFGM